jgi:hypothetical protein
MPGVEHIVTTGNKNFLGHNFLSSATVCRNKKRSLSQGNFQKRGIFYFQAPFAHLHNIAVKEGKCKLSGKKIICLTADQRPPDGISA